MAESIFGRHEGARKKKKNNKKTKKKKKQEKKKEKQKKTKKKLMQCDDIYDVHSSIGWFRPDFSHIHGSLAIYSVDGQHPSLND